MAVEKFGASERFACALLGQNRSAFRKKKPDMSFDEYWLLWAPPVVRVSAIVR